MPTYKLILEYDGTAYAGWQFQPDHPTIQAKIESVLARIAQTRIPVIAAGRTDAGVHAKGQVVSFSSEKPLPVREWMRALNGLLPKDIGVKHMEIVPERFHARYSALAKTYEYRIWNEAFRPVLLRHLVWHIPHRLDLPRMQEAASHVLGNHDFSSFQSSNTEKTNTLCHLYQLTIQQNQQDIRFIVTGNRFLKHMVRSLVGTLVEVGRMKREPNSLPHILAARDRQQAGFTAPPHGLTLLSVQYEPDHRMEDGTS